MVSMRAPLIYSATLLDTENAFVMRFDGVCYCDEGTEVSSVACGSGSSG